MQVQSSSKRPVTTPTSVYRRPTTKEAWGEPGNRFKIPLPCPSSTAKISSRGGEGSRGGPGVDCHRIWGEELNKADDGPSHADHAPDADEHDRASSAEAGGAVDVPRLDLEVAHRRQDEHHQCLGGRARQRQYLFFRIRSQGKNKKGEAVFVSGGNRLS